MDLINNLMNPEFLKERWIAFLDWMNNTVLTGETLSEILAVIAVFCLSLVLSKRLALLIEKFLKKTPVFKFLQKTIFYITWILLLWLVIGLYMAAGQPYQLVKIVASLLSAWVLINGLTALVRDPIWSRFITITVWIIAALNIVGFLDETVAFLGDLGFTVGEARVTALGVVKGFLALAFLLWFASLFSKTLEKRISKLPNLTPSTRVLFSKIARLTLFVVAFLVALNLIGIDLTAFAVFSGALGVGIGFGLQKVISNFVSGIILLLERSVKPGDVIALGDTYGWIQSLGARYVSVLTRDGTEHLIPNEEFITQKVENWSYSSNLIRIKVPVGVSYHADLDKARQLCLEGAKEAARVQPNPSPVCLIRGFGDSSVDLEVRFWINDPREGVANIMSDVYAVIWRKFHENDIEIPFPQRDLHIRSAVPLETKAQAQKKATTKSSAKTKTSSKTKTA